MQMNNIYNKLNNKIKFDTTEWVISLFVVLSFTVQLFSHIIASNSLLIIVLFILGLVTILLHYHNVKLYLPGLFMSLLFLIYIAINMIRPSTYNNVFSINKYVILFVCFAGLSLMHYSGDKSTAFFYGTRIILFFALFYAASVWFQVFFPSAYKLFLNFMPEANQSRILKGVKAGEYYTGFTSNPGFTGGYIVSGIFALVTEYKSLIVHKTTKIVLLLLLTITLLMTGRRAHTAFLIAALIGYYLLPYKGKIFRKRLKLIVVSVLVFILFVVFSWNYLIQIPLFSRINASILALFNDGDISSLRISLYMLAWTLFLKNPWFGIGWENFRYAVVGNVTKQTEFDVHNVYLQLLCETGIFGFIIIMIPIVIIFILTLRSIRNLENDGKEPWFPALSYSLIYQMFFLLYGLTGNPLYSPSYLMMYFFSSSITMAYLRFVKSQTRSKDLDQKHDELEI